MSPFRHPQCAALGVLLFVSCSFSVPDLTSAFEADGGSSVDAGDDAGSDAGTDAGFDAGFCAGRPAGLWCDELEAFDAGGYADFIPWNGTAGVALDPTAHSGSTAALVRINANNSFCESIILMKHFPGTYSQVHLETWVHVQQAQDLNGATSGSTLAYVQLGSGSRICALILAATETTFEVIEQVPLPDAGFQFSQHSVASTLVFAQFNQLELDYAPGGRVVVRVNGDAVYDAGVTLTCPFATGDGEFKTGLVCERVDTMRARRVRVDDVWFSAQ